MNEFARVMRRFVETEKKHPGYRFQQRRSDAQIFVNIQDETDQIVEVLGVHCYTEEDQKPLLKQPVVAVLRESDAKLYHLLDWGKGVRRYVTGEQMSLFQSAILFVGFWVLSFLAMVLVFGWTDTFLKVLLSIFSSIVLISLYDWAQYWFCKFYKGSCTWTFLKKCMVEENKDQVYYKELLKQLVWAHDRDKASAAATLLKRYFQETVEDV